MLRPAAAPATPHEDPTLLAGAAPKPIWQRNRSFMVAAILILALPILITGRIWGLDWSNHLWYVWAQGAHIRDGGPSLFIHTTNTGAFYPQFAFYGATAYSIAGSISAILGGKALVAYVAMILWSFVSAYGGLLWLSFQAGLSGWRAHAAPLLFVSGPFWLTNAYARGSFAELLATSALPLFIAAAVSLARAERIRFWPVVALLGSTVIYTGTHNITLLWGTVTLIALGFTALWVLPRHGREFPVRRIAALFGLAILAAAVNAWFLLPNLTFASRVNAGIGGVEPMLWDQSDWYDKPGVLFALLRGSSPQSDTNGLYTNLPMYSLLWVVISAGLVARTAERWVRRAMFGVGLFMVALIALMVWHDLWDVLPRVLHYIQFTFRLETFILLMISLLTILVLRAARDAPQGRGIARVLVPVLALSFGLGVWQTWSTQDSWATNRQDVFTGGLIHAPPTYYDGGSYLDASLPRIAVPTDRVAIIPLEQIKNDRFRGLVEMPGGSDPIMTTVAGAPYFVWIRGPFKVIGTEVATGWLVIQRTDPDPQPGLVDVSIRPVNNGPIYVGRVITYLALGLMALLLVLLAIREGFDRLSGRGRARAAPTAVA